MKTEELPESGEPKKLVKVIHGINDGCFEVAGIKVSRVRDSLVDDFNVGPDALSVVNGFQVDGEHLLEANDTLEFLYQWGQKGGSPWGRDKSRADGFDFYPTPSWATSALLEQESFGEVIWEPACGNGAISEVLKNHGYKVISTDLVDRGYGEVEDFLRSERRTENIITNPPYQHAEAFVRKSLTLTSNKVAMLLRLGFVESQKRHRLLTSTPLQSVYVFSRRLTMYRDGIKTVRKGSIAYAWFVWQHGYQGDPHLRWLPPDAGA